MALRKKMLVLGFLGAVLAGSAGLHYCFAAISCNNAATYSAKPIFIANAATPNIMLLFSNGHTNFYAGYGIGTVYNDSVEYYGYFDPKKEYAYSENYFHPVGYMTNGHRVTNPNNRWSGNWLNWATMSQADFVRKALTGGTRDVDSSDHTILRRADIPADGPMPGHEWTRVQDNAELYTPFSGTQTFTNSGINLSRSSGLDHAVRVEVCNPYVVSTNPLDRSTETNCTYYENGDVYKPEGLLQRFRDKFNIGLMSYSYAQDKVDAGGIVRVNIHDISDEINPSGGTVQNADGICGFINGFGPKSWDPLAELYYEAVRYFKGLTPTSEFCVSSPDGGFQVMCNQGGESHYWTDPVSSWCQKNFIVIINDEYPSKDSDKVPSSFWPSGLSNPLSVDVQDWTRRIGDLEEITGASRPIGQVGNGAIDSTCSNQTISNLGQVRGICGAEPENEGSFYTAGLAYYAHTTALRTNFSAEQNNRTNIKTYAIAFRASPSGYQAPPPPMNPLYLAAKYGGFDDVNQNGVLDPGEWEGDTEGGYVWPRTFAHAESGNDFEEAMLKVLNDILGQSSSGTAASVVTESEGGEGQLYQAYFEPRRANTAGTEEVAWIGFLQALWIDAWGNLREDSNGDHRLTLRDDKIVVIRYDEDLNRTVVDRYSDCDMDGVPDTVFKENCDGEASARVSVNLSAMHPIWEASFQLDQKTPANRAIKTFVDKNMNGVVDSDEFIDFNIANKSAILPFLGLASSSDLDNVINYIRGTDVTGWRNRVLHEGSTSRRYVLGDIVDSTPTPVSAPMDNYDMIYGDKTFLNYYNKYKNRPTYVYVGANDGMLHAFYGAKFHPADDLSTTSIAENAWLEIESGKTLGEEAWAYIPKNVLPHLQWLTCPTYPHVFYVDLKPKIFDARIFQADWNDPNAVHPNGWGTIMVCGMRFGGPQISLRADWDGAGGNNASTQYFKSAYFAFDITDPGNPRLLWEKIYDQMGYTFTYPAIMRLQSGDASATNVAFADQKWLIVLGNGPTDFNGDPSGYGRIYVVDLLTGNPVRTIQTATTGNVKEFMGSPVAVDLSTDYDADVIYIGSTIKNIDGTYSGKMYRVSADTASATPDFNPANWTPSLLIDVGKPVTAAPGVSQIDNKIWVYFGTGRYIGQQDKTTTALNSFYGIKDPRSFDYANASALPGAASVSEASNLLDISNINVYETGYVTGLTSGLHTWNDLLNAFSGASNYGWVLNLAQPTGLPSERVLVKPAVIGGLVLFPSFFPNPDVCAFSGNSKLYSLYYKTGTAWKKSTIGTSATQTVTVDDQVLHKILTNVDIGIGLPSQIAIHVGSEAGGRTFTQMSTSSIFELSFTPAMPMKSGFLYWRELED